MHLGEEPNPEYYELIEYKLTPSQVNEFYADGRAATVTGWGKVSDTFIQPNFMRGKAVKVVSNENCTFYGGPEGFNGSQSMCAWDSITSTICYGDAGGPLFVQSNGKYYQIGISSWAEFGCGAREGVFTRVKAFEKFITDNLEPIFESYGECRRSVLKALNEDRSFCRRQYKGRQDRTQKKACLTQAKNDRKQGLQNCKNTYK